MKSDRNILIAFLLNATFALIEFIGGLMTGSIAIASDAVHDAGDALSIGVAYILERKSKNKANEIYTYGYVRYSIIGGLITTLVLMAGSIFVSVNAINRIVHPVDINYTGMIWLAVAGVIINFLAAYFTKDGHSMNQKAVNLHMLEDVFGWVIVLIGAIVMNFTDFTLLDSMMSIVVAIFIFIQAIKTLKHVIDVLLEKAPDDFTIQDVQKHLSEIDGIIDVHHIHLWSIDGLHHCATMHVVIDKYDADIKHKVKHAMHKHGIVHTTIEVELPDEQCQHGHCAIEEEMPHHHHGHHHH